MNKWIKRLLIVFEIGGGFTGFVIILSALFSSQMQLIYILVSILFALFFLFGVFSGLCLIEDQKTGIKLSIVYQGIQIVKLSSPIVTYFFVSGFHLTPEIAFNRISIFFKLGAEFSFFILSKNPWSIGVNIVALGLFIYLLRIKKLIIK
ncbi:MAG: hypothetical protein KKH93_05305 [Candidatus Omnitrophica bacterium]|nr:hypothetical protein [Candidatus Omnitrophota bacterium]MBU2044710.1 hypothetical protein [Candidatus Omnitrophota bacterium]MBU2473479.1 hypothetical protein [Candidatus Omnitrophota bacterium]